MFNSAVQNSSKAPALKGSGRDEKVWDRTLVLKEA
jgi:hypothetical protein